MRIGQFSQLFQLAPETVRYYINKGLLVPDSRHERYLFSAQDVEDMELLLRLKGMRFSLAEIHGILSLRRLSHFDSEDELADYLTILKRQKKQLLREKSQLDEVVAQIDQEIATAAGKHTAGVSRRSGLPLRFLPYLACPHCQGGLHIHNAEIELDQILSAKLTCGCGFQAQVKDGILIGQPGRISAYDGPDLERLCYRNMSPDLITLMQKNYQWHLQRLEQQPTRDKLILEDYINDYCFCHANLEQLDPQALYILVDKFPEVVGLYKSLIEKMNLPHQILYLAAGSHLLPLREGCVDLYIDLTANEYAMFYPDVSQGALARYFHSQSLALGSFWHFDAGSRSLAELRQQYPETWAHNFDAAYFADYLAERWQALRAWEELGFVTDSGGGDSFSYHIAGEKLRLSNYYVQGFRGLPSAQKDHKS